MSTLKKQVPTAVDELGITKDLAEQVLHALARREILQVTPDCSSFRSVSVGKDVAWRRLRKGDFYKLDFPAAKATFFANLKLADSNGLLGVRILQ